MVILVDSRMSGDKYMCLISMSPLSDQVEPEMIQSFMNPHNILWFNFVAKNRNELQQFKHLIYEALWGFQ